MTIVESTLMFEQHVVHFPELPLHRSAFSGFGRVRGMRMAFAHREMAKHESQRGSKAALDL